MRQFIATYKIVNNGDGYTIHESKPYKEYQDAYKDLIGEMQRLKESKLPIKRLEYARVEFTERKTSNFLEKSYKKMFKKYLSDMNITQPEKNMTISFQEAFQKHLQKHLLEHQQKKVSFQDT